MTSQLNPLLVDQFQLFSNSSPGLFNLQASLVENTASLTIQVFDLDDQILYGRTHRPKDGKQIQTQLYLNHLRTGTYTVVLETETGILADRIIIQEE